MLRREQARRSVSPSGAYTTEFDMLSRPFQRTPGILAAIVAGLLLPAGCSDPTGPDANSQGQIVFVSSREGVMRGASPLFDIFRVNPDGSGLENLTRTPGWYDDLDVTPDGRTIVFGGTLSFDPWQGSNCPTQVWRIGVDGTGLRKVTTDGCSVMPRLSPDGGRIAYLRGNEVWVINLDGSGARHVSASLPAVQPNACGEVPKTTVRTIGWVSTTRLLFSRHICLVGSTDYAVNVDGSSLATVDFIASSAHLSPDRNSIAHVRNQGMDGSSLVVMNADGTNERIIATPAAIPSRFDPAGSVWSPDGTRLYHWSPAGHFTVRRDGTGTQQIAAPWPTFPGAFRSWSPDGSRLAFVVYDQSASHVAVMNADGTGLVHVTSGSGEQVKAALWVRQ